MHYRIVAALALVVLLGIALGAYSRAEAASSPVVEIVRNIPLGAPRSFADGYLKKGGFEFSYDKATRVFFIMIRNTQNSLVRKDVQVLLKIGQGDEVSEIVIKQVFTGP